ncbi:DinB family protein [Spirosoma rhododendri]|uniref:DinB family protein n=1 Tax=Spirosoma rhododendri TaxID=2728024 RepID=A0A7L5DTB0_9BACT|nr:DinB family protein [Spirosoma rhododendri]QJD81656.1 DinB family protein [Spirosoma rhododendri]
MKTVVKQIWLEGLEQQVEKHIQEAVQIFQNKDEALLRKPAMSGGWSVVQCLAHLNSYGQYYLPRLKQELIPRSPGQHTTTTFTSSWLGGYLTRLMDPGGGLIKFKAARRHQPLVNLPAHTVVAEFIDQQEELLRLLQAAQDHDLTTIRIPMSVAAWIRLPVGNVLQFLIVHTERHLIQARRNIDTIAQKS